MAQKDLTPAEREAELARREAVLAAREAQLAQEQAELADQGVNRDQLHTCDQVSLALGGRHEGTRPGWGIFNEWTGKWNAGFIGVADCMRDTGIWDSGYQIGVGLIAFGKHTTAVVPHFLDVDSFVAGGRITVVNPQERTDFHFLASRAEYLYAVGVHADDLARSQFFVVRVSKVDVCKAFKGNTERTIFASDDRRGTSEAVTGDIDALRGQQENGRCISEKHYACINEWYE